MQWKEENRALFAACLNGLEDEPMVRAMDAIPQHVKGVSCYDHCLFVAYVGFTLCRIFGLDYRAAARAGLLHDLYLQKWEETDVGRFRRLVIHPQLALENARAFGLSPMEEDIIGKHMWPLTAPLPYYKGVLYGEPGRIRSAPHWRWPIYTASWACAGTACLPPRAAAPGRAVKTETEAAAGRQRGFC